MTSRRIRLKNVFGYRLLWITALVTCMYFAKVLFSWKTEIFNTIMWSNNATPNIFQVKTETEKNGTSSILKFQGSELNSNDYDNEKEENTELRNFLVGELTHKLSTANDRRNLTSVNTACQDLKIDYQERCFGTGEFKKCPQQTVPTELGNRIDQLVFRENLQVDSATRSIIKNIGEGVAGNYDVIIVSAASSNHYLELQAMLLNLHMDVFPLLKNFTLVVFDLGLTEKENKELQKYCRCQVLQFPFELFPEHYRTLKCFAWKPTVIRAMYERTNFVIWTDTSIRIYKPEAVPMMIEQARIKGIQQRLHSGLINNPYHTLPQMFEFFGDSPCAHMAFYQVESGYGIYHREPLVEKAILDPWVGCAIRSDCTCPVDQKTVQLCPGTKGEHRIGLCMRNDQSSLSIILAKLFREKYFDFAVSVRWFQVARRKHEVNYFDMVRNKKNTTLSRE